MKLTNLLGRRNALEKNGLRRMRRSHQLANSSRPNIEVLEHRLLLAADIRLVNNDIIVNGTPEKDVITIRYSAPNRIHVKVNSPGTVVQRAFNVDPKEIRILADGKAGNDTITNLIDVAMSGYGGDGNDVIRGGSGTDTLSGANGNDKLYGFGSDDFMYGNAGADSLYGGAGNDSMGGGTGPDRMFGQAGHDEMHGDNGTVSFYSTGAHVSTGNNDYLAGGSGSDRIFGNGGNDVIHGNTGNDLLEGQGGNDRIFGHKGEDALFGGTENDILIGDAGHDEIHGNSGNDKLYGNSGNDSLRAGEGDDFVRGHEGNDYLEGGFGNDRLLADQGTDTLDGGNGNDRLDGGVSKDRTDGGDHMFGGSGNDMMVGYYGNDYMEAGQGNDTLHGNQGFDYLDGNDNDDVLFGHAGSDVLRGGSGNDRIDGSSGNDKLYGMSGNDRLDGQAGHDTLMGGEGNDRLFGDHPKDKVGGRDYVDGESGNDYLGGYAGDDSIFGGPGVDKLYGHYGDDYLEDDVSGGNLMRGGPGDNTVQYLFNPGDLHASVSKDGKSLHLAGTDRNFPGSGFTLLAVGSGSWKTTRITSGSQYRYTHSLNGSVFLDQDGDGQLNTRRDMKLTHTGLTINTFAAESVEAAVVDPKSLNFNLLGNPIDRFLQSLKKTLGIEIGLPGFRFGIASGQDLMDRDDTLPLRESQPYLHFSIQSGLSLKFGSIELTSKTANSYLPQGSYQIIMDPTDPFVLVKNTLGGVGAAVGISENGRIPFYPVSELKNWNNEMFGHLYMELEGIPLPYGFSVDGSFVLDLDANDDGVSGRDISRNTGQFSPTGRFWNQVGNSLDDISLGVNGKLYFGDFGKFFKSGFLNKFFKEMDLSVEIARGSIVLDGELEEIHFKGEKSNPFAGTPLERLEFLNQKMELSGSVTQLDASPKFNIDWYQGTNGAVTRSTELHLNNSGVQFRGEQTVLGQGIVVHGGISSTGVITLSGSGRFAIGIASEDTGELSAGLNIRIDARASITDVRLKVSGELSAWANAITYPFGLKTGFASSLDMTGVIELGSKATSFRFDARASFTLYAAGVPLTASPSFRVSVGPDGFSFTILGVAVHLNW